MLNPADYAPLIGKPFVRGARGPDAFDCYGLILELNKLEGIDVPDFKSPDGIRDVADIVDREKGAWTIVPRTTIGATLLFRIEDRGAHVGYLVSRDTFIHADEVMGVMLSRLSRDPWGNRFIQAYRFEA